MRKQSGFTKILALAGTLLVWIPLLAPVLFAVVSWIQEGVFQLDYLMPAELFPVVLVGGGLLLWAALRARSYWRIIVWCLAIGFSWLVIGQLLAFVTGLASGKIEPAGLWWALVLASIVIYALAVVGIGIGGILLLRELFKRSR